MKRADSAQAAGKEEMCDGKNEQKPVKGLGSSDHEALQPHMTLERAEENLDRPAMRIILQDRLIRERGI